MWRLADTILSLLIPAVIFFHLACAPYTKVEESFNIQATHDLLSYQIPYSTSAEQIRRYLHQHYDHLTFTGPVPRTFIGPLALAGPTWLLRRLALALQVTLNAQLTVRAVLGAFNAYCLISFRNGVAKTFGRNAANWYSIFQASQFHMMYYASRTLPNFLAFGLTTLAMRRLLPLAGRSPSSPSSRRHFKTALIILTVTGIIFRSEVAILLAAHTVYLFLQPHIALSLRAIISAGSVGVIVGLALTIPIDTYFWQSSTPLWPELQGFIYNVVNGRSVDWGTQSWHFYFTSALPRLLFNPYIYHICLPFALLIPILRRAALDVTFPNILFLLIYSFQPHKEWRFIIYVVPPLLAVSSAGASWIWTRRAKSFVYRVLSLAMVASTLASFAASSAMLSVSRRNYPGGIALERLHALASNGTGVLVVHMDTLACMTGVTRFLQIPPPVIAADGPLWVYDKTENEEHLLDPIFWSKFDYTLAERPEKVIGNWEVLETVESFSGIELVRPGEPIDDVLDDQGVMEHYSNLWGKEKTSIESWSRWIVSQQREAIVLVRKYVTKGWWVKARMKPSIRILKRRKRLASNIDADSEPSPV